jgi:hypothetical protein
MARKASPEESQAAAELEAALEQEGALNPEAPADSAGPAPLALNTDGGEVPPKRKPGRPPKDQRSGSNAEDLLTNAVGGGETPTGKKPGRPAGKSKGGDPVAIGNQLVGIHQLVAMFTGTPEMIISAEEGAALGKAVVDVCNEYGLSVDGKTGAAIQLFAACAMIYAPRVMAVRFRYAQEALARQNEANSHGVGYPAN